MSLSPEEAGTSSGRFDSREQARREVFGYIEGFYTTHRLHSGLGYVSPAEYEREHRLAWLDREAA